jgi:hypothetical protein
MATANERQVGGAHYKGSDYQHWDWVCDIKLHYLPACASKYVSRHRGKNGKEDLEKAIHYIDKAEEEHITGAFDADRQRKFWRFVLENNLTLPEAAACYYIMEGQWTQAREATLKLF